MMKQILFFSKNKSSFTEKDLDILRTKFEVKVYNPKEKNLFKIYRLIRNSDVLFFWFASINFLFPLLLGKGLGKRIVIVAGGYDVAKVPEIEYGSFMSPARGQAVLAMLKAADRIICISRSNCSELLSRFPAGEKKTNLIYHGFEPVNVEPVPKKNSVVTVGLVDSVSFKRKGFDRFLAAAASMPFYEFHHVGRIDPSIKLPEYKNVIFHGYLSDEQFRKVLNEAKVYLQLSRHEGFGCSVADAMQFGCIPVVSDAYSLPEVVGNCGIVVKNPDNMQTVSEAIAQVFRNSGADDYDKCRKYVAENFDISKRKAALITTIDHLS